MNESWAQEELRNTDFSNTEKVHDWRNHIGTNVRSIWTSFTHSQRLAIAQDACEQANKPEAS